MLAIRLDERTANLFTCGNDGHPFQCTRCSFVTDFQDCLLPHELYHQFATIPAAAAENDDLTCEKYRLISPSKISFEQHLTKFHAPIAESQGTELNDNGGNGEKTYKNNYDVKRKKPFQCKVNENPKINMNLTKYILMDAIWNLGVWKNISPKRWT